MARKYWTRKRIEKAVKAVVVLIALGWFVWWIKPGGEKTLTFARDAAVFAATQAPTGSELAQGGGLTEYADDGKLTLSADLKTQLFVVRDKASGTEWRSSPDPASDGKLNELTTKLAASPFMVAYTKSFADSLTTGLLKEQTTWKAYPIAHGLGIRYTIANLKLAFTAEYTLKDGGLEVRVPDDSIEESGDAAFVSLQAFPMFGAARQGDEGYMVVPDGSGAITYFNKTHKLFDNRGYAKWIYGMDPSFDPLDAPVTGEQIAAPVFGMVKPDGAYIQTLTGGASDARVLAMPPGALSLDYYRGGFDMSLRKAYYTSYGAASKPIPQIERNRIFADRAVRFDFAAGSGKTYADLASLAGERLYPRKAGEAANKQATPLIELFLGVETRGDSFSKRLETMTTFAQAQTILGSFRKLGMTDLSAGLKGWTNGGYYGKLPDRFPAESDFGGNGGLKKLLDWSRENGISMSLEDNLIDIYRKEKDGVDLRTDAVRKPDSELYVMKPVGTTGWYRWGVEWHWLSPYVIDKDYMQQELESLGKLGVDAVDYRHFGEDLYSDYNRKEPLRRSETQRYIEQWLKDAHASLGSVGVYYGNDYAARAADRVLDIPLDASNDYLLDESVPFLQMMMHGSLPYYGSALNRTDDPERELLKAVEYGAVPSFELTYGQTTELRYTNYDVLFSSQYADWTPAVKEAYAAWQEAIAPVNGLRMTGHERKAEGLYATTYEDGTEVWVNYGDADADADGMNVRARSYAVKKGGEAK